MTAPNTSGALDLDAIEARINCAPSCDCGEPSTQWCADSECGAEACDGHARQTGALGHEHRWLRYPVATGDARALVARVRDLAAKLDASAQAFDALVAEVWRAAGETHEPPADVAALLARVAAARREGAEAMREACATVATEHAAAARARRSAFCEDDRGYDSADAALDAAEEIAAAIRAIPLPEARPPATVPCGVCDGRGKVLLGREVEDGCDECGASGRVDAVAEVARLRERVKHHQMQATHHAIVDMDAREAAKRGADALRAQFAEARRLLAAAARGDLPRCDECPHAATLYVATTAGEFHRCDAHAGGDEWETLPHAAALRAAMGGAK